MTVPKYPRTVKSAARHFASARKNKNSEPRAAIALRLRVFSPRFHAYFFRKVDAAGVPSASWPKALPDTPVCSGRFHRGLSPRSHSQQLAATLAASAYRHASRN